jgi:hypothetical protein
MGFSIYDYSEEMKEAFLSCEKNSFANTNEEGT